MEQVSKIYRFGLPYLWKYRTRFVLSILLGFAFATLNASFVPVTKLLVDRIDVRNQPVEKAATEPVSNASQAEAASEASTVEPDEWAEWKEEAWSWLDPWLPMGGRTMDWRQYVGGFLLLPVLAFLRGSVNYISSYYSAWVASRVVMDMRLDVFAKLQTMSMDFFQKEKRAETLGRVNADVFALQSVMQLGLQDLIKAPFSVLMILFFLVMIDWQLTLLFVIFLPMIMIPVILISKKVKKRGVASHKLHETTQSALIEGFANMRVNKAYNLHDAHLREFRERLVGVRGLELSSIKARNMLNPIIEFITAMGVGTIILFIFATDRSVGDLTGFIVGLGMLFTPVKKLAGLPNYFASMHRPVERLTSLSEMIPSVISNPKAPQLGKEPITLAFEGVDFSYEEGNLVLEKFDLNLPPGFRLGLAGHSGSGKSTIINLVFRFYDPSRGRVSVNGKDLRELELGSYLEHLALVSQDVLLFNLTVAENIALGRSSNPPSREEIVEAAKKAHAHEFIEALPQGYDTTIGERGERLSGGQRQRLSIARAFVRNAPILVLDEATGALDAEAEAIVQQAIDELAENRTVICIAHRLSTLYSMDEILVLEAGRTVERGTFAQLLENGGAFAGMAARQGIQLDTLQAGQRDAATS